MPDRIVHIGFPKTATTFLQKSVFPNFGDINFIDYRTCEEIFFPIMLLDDIDLDLDQVNSKLQRKLSNDKLNLFSFEGLCGAPFIYKGLSRSAIPSRLKKIGFNKVIITIRDQVSQMDSLYRQYILQGGVVRFKDFIDFNKKFNLYNRVFNLEYLNYFKLIKLYQEVFGIENVLVLSHVQLITDQTLYIRKLTDFMKIDERELLLSKSSDNVSLSNLSINTLRRVNHFIFTSQRQNNLIWNKISTRYVSNAFKAIIDPYIFRFLSSKKSYAKSEHVDFIREYYKISNQKLSDLLRSDFTT